jgi:hypothetical protein
MTDKKCPITIDGRPLGHWLAQRHPDTNGPIRIDERPLAHWLTQRELARHLDISTRSLERLRHAGNGPRFAKAGKKILYKVGHVEDWLAARTYTSTGEAKKSGIR